MIQYGSYDYTQGYTLTEMLLAKAEPTALIAGDDFMALGAIEALKKAGLQCPKDISIVSFNDFFFSKHTSPALSTVQIPFRKLGREVARNIVRLIEGETVSEKILKGEFIIRGSTSPVHHKARTGTHLNKQEI